MSPAARLRGLGAASVTATLAVAAHAAAGAGLPSSVTLAELAVLATAIGAIAVTMLAGTSALLVLLATGQLLGHLLFEVAGHSHATHVGPPAAAMWAAHVAAVAIGALLIAAGEHLCAAVSNAVRAVEWTNVQLPSATTTVVNRGADQPMRSTLLLAASMSYRGPPVSPAH